MPPSDKLPLSHPAADTSSRDDIFARLVDAVEDYAIFVLDRHGVVSSWNPGARKIKGYERDEIVGRHFSTFYPPHDVQRGWPEQELAMAALHGRFEDEGWRVRKDGSRFWANVIITALRHDDGELYGFAKITRDLSERRRDEELLRQSEERFRLLVDSVRDHAIYMLAPDGRIESWNSGAQALKGYPAAEVLGRHFSMFFTAEDRAAGKPQQELNDALRTGRVQGEGWRVRRDGSVFWATVKLTAVHDAEGRPLGFAKVTRDMTEQRRLAELEHSARRISQFLAMLGHELRNPLAPIRNAVSLMRLDPAFPPSLRASRDIIDRQLTHVTRLVDDLLDVGRITTGKLVLRREPITWREVVTRSVEMTVPLVESRGHTLDVQVPEQSVVVHGDPVRLVQMLQNLIHNAARYTPPGGHIQVHVSMQGDIVVTDVRDNGRGIEPDALDRIFDLFVQESPHGMDAEGGLGIGLTLARILAELHGGSLRVASAGKDQGSTFTLRLPIRRAAGSEAEGAAGTARPEKAYPVLIVDDNRDSADTMGALINAMGHPAHVVYNGADAVAAARELAPQVILLDLHMPRRDGFEVLADLRALTLPHRPRIVAMTGYGQEADRVRTAEAGFDDHFTKPVEPEQLAALLGGATTLQ